MKVKKVIAGVAALAIAVMAPQIYTEGKTLFAEEASAIVDEEYAQAVSTDSDYEYTVLEDGTLCLKKYKGGGGDVVVPDMIDGKRVTKIGDYTFRYTKEEYYTGIKSITIPEGVTEIGSYVFCCYYLTSVNIPDSVESMGSALFDSCVSLTAVNIGSGNRNFVNDNGVLYSKDKNRLIQYLPYKIDKAYVIPNSVVVIDHSAFKDCTVLTSVVVPNSVTDIGDSAFSGCESLNVVNLPNKITQLKSNVFSDCISLTSINIPDSVTKIFNSAFDGCTSLTEINVDSGNEKFVSFDGVLFSKSSGGALRLEKYPVGKETAIYQIPENVKYITRGAFADCKFIKSIALPKSMTTITSGAFEDCGSLTSVCIPNSITEIEYQAFDSCSALSSVIIPNNVTEIGSSAFQGCRSLTSIFIPENVTTINGSYVFNLCSDNLIIYGITGSYAETYADENNINFNGVKSVNSNGNNLGVEVLAPASVPAAAVLKVEKISADEESITYDISLTADGKSVDLKSESAVVKIPVPDEENKLEYKVYRKEANGKYSDMQAVVSGEFLVFVTDHFSEYIVTFEKLVPDTVLGDVNGDQTVNDQDSMLLSRYLAEWGNEIDTAAADINGDGRVNDQDGIVLARTLAGWYD